MRPGLASRGSLPDPPADRRSRRDQYFDPKWFCGCSSRWRIPVLEDEQGNLSGAMAVIDKDFGVAILAISLQADLFIISTAVEKVAITLISLTKSGLIR